MTKIASKPFVLIALLLALCCQACQPEQIGSGVKSQPEQIDSGAQDQIDIYQAVVRRLCGADDTFGGTLDKPVVYIIRATNDAAGDPFLQGSASLILSEVVQQGLSTALSDMSSEIVWVDRLDDVARNPLTREALDHGVTITLGNITYEGTRARVAGSIYIANMAAAGKTYVLDHSSGVWVIIGTTGSEWIS